MERLTNEFGMICTNEDCQISEEQCPFLAYELKEREECQCVKEIVERLKAYEIAEENGLLLKLPCKIGDTLYRLDTDIFCGPAEIEPFVIDNIVFCNDGDILFKYDAWDGIICHLEHILTDTPYLDDFRIFLTKEAAEAELNKLRGK